MVMGRPTKYNQELQEAADHYIDNFATYGDKVPTAARLALVLRVNKATLYEWASEHDDFSDTLNRCNQTQEYELINNGLDNTYNASITKLMLANHGYHEKKEQKITGTMGLAELSEEDLDRRIEEVDRALDRSTED